MKQPAVYIMANGRNGTLYTGVTSDLVKRVWEHRTGTTKGLTKRYGSRLLVWYEAGGDMEGAFGEAVASVVNRAAHGTGNGPIADAVFNAVGSEIAYLLPNKRVTT